MTAATALVAGNDASPDLAAAAVEEALRRAGASRANGVLLLLTCEFARCAAAAVQAASRAAQCLQVAGGIVGGLTTERSWLLDRPGAAVLVLGGELALANGAAPSTPVFSVSDSATLPAAWRDDSPRLGLLFHDPLSARPLPAWQHGRLAEERPAGIGVRGAEARFTVSTGLRILGAPRPIDSIDGYDLACVGGTRALDALIRDLPPEFRQAPLPLHQLSLVVVDADEDAAESLHLLPVLAANADRSLTIGERLLVGQRVAWAIRQPMDTERDLRRRIDRLRTATPSPDFGLFLSCIGRGPYYYGDDDRDWQVVRECFPGMPFLGGYGSAQIVPSARGNLALQNSVALALFSASEPETHRVYP